MQGSLSQSTHTLRYSVSLGANHGYRVEGDTAILNAELSVAPLADQDAEARSSEHWALQLWACESPHQGGPLRGIKVAEAAVALPDACSEHESREHLEAAAIAQLPPVQREYAMVLVLASGSAGRYDQVHDFSNFAARQHFAGPHLEGSVGYRFEGDAVVLQAQCVRNPRPEDNLSGSLTLQLWALPEAYAGGAFVGSLLGSSELDRLGGQGELRAVEQRVALSSAPVGSWRLALMLREWTGAGYVTRDYCNFAEPHVVAAPHAEPLDTHARADDGPDLSVSDARHDHERDTPRTSEPVAPEGAPAKAVAPEVAPAKAVVAPAKAAAPEVAPAKAAAPEVAPAKARAPEVAPAKAAALAPVAQPTRSGARVSVQTASVEDLAKVPGLNKKLAQAIVRARPIASLDELKSVRGIGDKMLQQLRTTLSL